MMTTVKRVKTPEIGSPLDVVCGEIFELECEVYKVARDLRAMKRRLKDLRKARTILTRLAPKEEPTTNNNW
jgi:hypothetical protein